MPEITFADIAHMTGFMMSETGYHALYSHFLRDSFGDSFFWGGLSRYHFITCIKFDRNADDPGGHGNGRRWGGNVWS